MDRVAEAAPKLNTNISDNDIVICIQGDEPMLYPDMISAPTMPLWKNEAVDVVNLSPIKSRNEQ